MKKDLSTPLEKYKAENIFRPLESVDDLVDWMYIYFDITFPKGVVYPESTHAPADAIWRIYELMKTGESEQIPEVVMLSSRDSFKTLAAAAAEVLCLVHFRFSIAHASAILSQSEKAVQYINSFFNKIKPYLEHHGWKKTGDNKTKIEWTTENNESIYLRVLVMTRRGMNSEHVPMLFCVDGKTNILIKNKGNIKRSRKNATARGIYQKIKKGESVEILSFNHNLGKFEFKKCLAASKLKKDIYRLETKSGKYIDASLDHPVYIFGKGYTPIGEINEGDKVFILGKAHTESTLYYDTVSSIKFLKNDDVFDFTIQDNHNFFGNGILTHNCDEIDLIADPQALEEAKMVPAVYGKYFPLTVSLSTRKYAGGLMEKKIKEVTAAGGEILRWNIIDVTERISLEEAMVNEAKEIRYIKELPMQSLTHEEWSQLNGEERNKFERVEIYKGIANHKLLPIMRNYLVDRPQNNFGNLYKPVSAVLNNFKQTSPEMANAQLLCNKPSSSGLVYPRFDAKENTLTIQEAYKKIFDIDDPNITLEEFKEACLKTEATFIGGGDWGYTDFTSLVVMLLIGGDIILVDAFCADQLELDDIVKYAKDLNEQWNVSKWYVDQAYPAYIATLKRHGLSVPEFKKVVEDGIAALQYRISDSSNKRRFFVLRQPNTEHVIQSFEEYKWSTDAKGDIIEGKPYHDSSFISDVQDSIRYPMQVLFGKPKKKPQMMISAPEKKGEPINSNYGKQIMDYVKATTGADIKDANKPSKKKKGVVWSV